MRRKGVLLAGALLLLMPTAARADDRLSDDGIRKFYETMLHAYRLPYDEYLAALTASLADDFQQMTAVTMSVPGQAPRQSTDQQTKASMLTQARVNYESLKTAQIDNKIGQVQIAADGKSAVVQDQTTAHGIAIKVPGGPTLSADIINPCTDTLTLGPAGKPQIVKSVCLLNTAVSSLPK